MNEKVAKSLFLHFYPCSRCNLPLKDDKVTFVGVGKPDHSWGFTVQCTNCRNKYTTYVVLSREILIGLIGDLTPMEWVKRTKGRADNQPVSVEYQNWIRSQSPLTLSSELIAKGVWVVPQAAQPSE